MMELKLDKIKTVQVENTRRECQQSSCFSVVILDIRIQFISRDNDIKNQRTLKPDCKHFNKNRKRNASSAWNFPPL